ncbi:hypothetical protein OIT41_08695 [Arthrobacter sp. YA7-1]|uniref:hypothetical protein n=1 Tax=Arthrobacter sp. YA7-1 TaxID=2987701 RepID=UPI002226B3C8|nr:hypothetical protein [Arthrobacter sp. YA7-1]UYY83092.1 hypothetical protein OIT41_08695 [Arthrobacter sp. YA7-1]
MTSFTSDELAALAAEIPTRAMDRGLLYVEDAEFVNKADVQLSSAAVALDSALAIALGSRAPFVSLDVNRFDGELLRLFVANEDGLVELPAVVEGVIDEASSHEDEVETLTLRWPAQGLVIEWTAATDWHEAFWEKLAAARAAASREVEEESATEQALYQAQLAELEAALAASQDFRAASVMKRRAVAEAIASAIDEDLVGTWGFRHTLTEANALAKRRIFEYEHELSERIPELVEELIRQPQWRIAGSMNLMREVALKFLAKKADGYRLSAAFADQLVHAALTPEM